MKTYESCESAIHDIEFVARKALEFTIVVDGKTYHGNNEPPDYAHMRAALLQILSVVRESQ